MAKMTDSLAASYSIKARALIFTVQKFYPPHFSKRLGASNDTKKLHSVLFNLGFEVTFKIDYTAEEILQEYREESCRTHGSCFISIISSHGEEGVIYGSDCRPVNLGDIYSMFTPHNCPSLAGKPKIFFIQACRGSELDDGVYVETDGVTEMDSGCSLQNSFSHYEAVPEDTVVHFSTSPGREPPGGVLPCCSLLCPPTLVQQQGDILEEELELSTFSDEEEEQEGVKDQLKEDLGNGGQTAAARYTRKNSPAILTIVAVETFTSTFEGMQLLDVMFRDSYLLLSSLTSDSVTPPRYYICLKFSHWYFHPPHFRISSDRTAQWALVGSLFLLKCFFVLGSGERQ
ncbi:caspase drICE-like [Mustelus asterias]